MSVRLWAYEPDKCDGDCCPNECDMCSKAEIDEEHIPLSLAYGILQSIIKSNPKEQTDDNR